MEIGFRIVCYGDGAFEIENAVMRALPVSGDIIVHDGKEYIVEYREFDTETGDTTVQVSLQ